MAKPIAALVSNVRSRINRLLYDQVIEHTIVVMRELSSYLNELHSALQSKPDMIDEELKTELEKILIPLTSESIREALHKGELPITNGIIRSKNKVLTLLKVPIPEDHAEIDPRDYPTYNW